MNTFNLDNEQFGEENFWGPDIYFGNLLAQGNYSKALEVFERNNLKISSNNKYVSSIEDLALKAAQDHSRKGNYEGAYVSLLTHAPKNPNIKKFAMNFAADMLSRLIEAYDYFEEDGAINLIKELTYDLHYLEKAHFPEGLRFKKKGGDVSLSSIIDSHRVSKLFENYFFHINSLNDEINDLIKAEDYRSIKNLDNEFKHFDEVYSGFSFIGYINNQKTK